MTLDLESWLSILHVLSDALTMVFALLGLVNDFRDKETNRISKTGRVALIGVIASFIVSTTMTGLEQARSRREQEAHAQEIRRLARPLGTVSMYLIIEGPATSDRLKRMARYSNIPYRNLPAALKRKDDPAFPFAY